MFMSQYRKVSNDELMHYGVKGMRWGVRKKRDYQSTSVRGALARRQNDKIDQGFDDWKENAAKKQKAIDLGKEANKARIEYERDRSNKELKSTYKQANKEYKKALKDNTLYRQGSVREEVGKDISRKYLTEAKKVKKELDKNPDNRDLQKQYNRLLDQHEIERAAARRAQEVGAKRSAKKASMKRQATTTVKGVATAGAVAAGMAATNYYLNTHNVTLNGQPIRMTPQTVIAMGATIAMGKEFVGYFY